MKEKSSFTTEKPIDYTQTKDAYDGNLNSTNYHSANYNEEPLPESSRPRKDGPGGE